MSKKNTANKSSTPSEEIEDAPVAEATADVERRPPSNNIFIGQKPVMSYAMSALIQLTQSGEVILKARGMAVSRAVDVAEIVTKRLGNNVYAVKDIKIDTEKVGTGDDIRSVSSIEIIVGKK